MAATMRTARLTAAESFWYVLGCISFGATYFAKVPVKKALSEVGLAEMTSAERFWYVLQCIAFGAGYLAKVPVKKALSEAAQVPAGHDPGSGHRAVPPPRSEFWPEALDDPDPEPALPPGRHQARHSGRGQRD
jgi:hypothetical protein